MSRLGEIDTEMVFDRVKRLQQLTTVEAYYDEFEKIRGQVLMKIPCLTYDYFLENFIGGLNPEIRSMIRLLDPTSLGQPLRLARFYEQTTSVGGKKNLRTEKPRKVQLFPKFSCQELQCAN